MFRQFDPKIRRTLATILQMMKYIFMCVQFVMIVLERIERNPE